MGKIRLHLGQYRDTGNQADFEEVVRLHDNRLQSNLYLMGCPADVIADIRQETWCLVHSCIHSYNGTSGGASWINSIARNCLNQHRRANRAQKRGGKYYEQVELDETMLITDRCGETVAMHQESLDYARKVAASLGEVYVDVLNMMLEGYRLREIKAELGINDPQRAVAKVRRHLKNRQMMSLVSV